MNHVRHTTPRFHVGDWVCMLYGARTILAQIVEDRGPIGYRGRRLYRVRPDLGPEDETMIELPEADFSRATEADKASWQAHRSVALHQTMTYHGSDKDQNGRPKPFFHYLVVAKPGPESGSGVATIISLSEARATGMAQSPSHAVQVQQGGPKTALVKAEEYLDGLHLGLKKNVGEIRP
jgi:hypothetical protein